jgi:hypothetical protein
LRVTIETIGFDGYSRRSPKAIFFTRSCPRKGVIRVARQKGRVWAQPKRTVIMLLLRVNGFAFVVGGGGRWPTDKAYAALPWLATLMLFGGSG